MEPKPGATPRRWPDHRPLTLRVEEAAQLLGISRSTAYEHVKTGHIPSLKFGRARRVPRAAVDQLIAEALARP